MSQAVILAGGKGTRLAAELQGKPKCLVDVDGTPLLQRQIIHLKACGVDDIVVLVNFAADQVVRFLSDNDNFGLRAAVVDDGDPRGTAGAVLASLDNLAERFIVVYGDTLFNVDVRRLEAHHIEAGAQATLFLHPNDHPFDSDLVEVDEQRRIVAFHPSPHPPDRNYSNLVSAALYVVERRALEAWRRFKTPSDFGKDLFPAMLAAGSFLEGYASFEYIKDIGTPKRLAKGIADLRRGVVARGSLNHKQKAVFVDRDGTLNPHRGFLRRADQFDLFPGIAESVRRLNELEYRVIVVTNQPVIARGESSFRDVRDIHDKLETLLGGVGAYVDAIYMCPHHPDRGFPGEVAELKIACDCRKPGTGMIERATADFNIDLAQSWLIGDTTSDIEVARRAGLRSILVRTGEGGLDKKYSAEADHMAEDFNHAVAWIAGKSSP